MKRTVSFLVALVMVLSLTVCGQSSAQAANTPTAESVVTNEILRDSSATSTDEASGTNNPYITWFNRDRAETKSTSILTVEKAAEVNTVAHLLQRYKTVTYAQLDYIGGNTIHMTYTKDKDGKCCGIEDSFGYSSYRTDCFAFYREKGKSEYHFSATKSADVSDYLFMVADSQFTSQTTDVNGNLVCMTQADISQEYADYLSEYWPATTKDKMVTTTIFAADDFRVLSVDFSLRRPDGSESRIASGVLLYDQEVQYTEAVQGYLDAEKVTVSIQMEDGSIRTALIPKGETFIWHCDDGYALYLDKDGKTLLPEKSEPVQSAFTLYCLPKK